MPLALIKEYFDLRVFAMVAITFTTAINYRRVTPFLISQSARRLEETAPNAAERKKLRRYAISSVLLHLFSVVTIGSCLGSLALDLGQEALGDGVSVGMQVLCWFIVASVPFLWVFNILVSLAVIRTWWVGLRRRLAIQATAEESERLVDAKAPLPYEADCERGEEEKTPLVEIVEA